MKTALFLFICLFTFNLQGQEVVLSFKNKDLSKHTSKDSYTVLNTKNKDLAIVILENKDAFVSLYDSNFEEISKFRTSNIKPKFNEVLGYSINGNIYSIFYTNNLHKKFAFHCIDFNSNTSSVKEIELNLDKKEILLDAVSYNNDLYLFTANNNNLLTLRKYVNNDFKILKTFFLEEIKEYTSLINSKVMVGAFIMLSGSKTPNVTKIDSRVPNTIERTSNKNKLYQNKNFVYLTFDNNEENTILYTINFDNLDLKVDIFPYPKPQLNEDFKKYNSFIFQNNIYQIACSKDEMAFEIKDFKGQILKEFYINRNLPINFKNSPIIQEGATALPFITTRKLEQTSKYLRKISAGNPGINVQKINNSYYITLGGYQVINTGGHPLVVSSPTMVNGAFISYNPTYLSYSSYNVTKSTYFNTILNSDFEHIKTKVESNNFDLVESYKKTIKYNTAEDVFYINNALYFGYFNLKESEYNLVKIKN